MRHAITGHLLRYRRSVTLDVCSIYASGPLTPLALHLTHSPMPQKLITAPGPSSVSLDKARDGEPVEPEPRIPSILLGA